MGDWRSHAAGGGGGWFQYEDIGFSIPELQRPTTGGVATLGIAVVSLPRTPDPLVRWLPVGSRGARPSSAQRGAGVPTAPGPLLLLLVRLAALRDGAHVSRDPVRRPGPLVVLHELPLLEQLRGGGDGVPVGDADTDGM